MQNQMTAKLMDGKAVAESVRGELKERVDKLASRHGRPPGLAVMLIGENPASQIYVKNKTQSCKKVGIASHLHQFGEDAQLNEILDCINSLNQSPAIDGILVQLPLPKHLPTEQILFAVNPRKDVDGLHPHNLGLLASGKVGLRPCTPLGIMVLLERYNVELEGRRAVVIGRSNLVGKPISLMLMEKNATVTMCHSRSRDLDAIVREGDVVIAAAGKAELVSGSWLKTGAVVIDVGIHRRNLADGQSEIVGDVNFQEALPVASLITPVPGGVGPMTVAMLLSNAVQSYETTMVHGEKF